MIGSMTPELFEAKYMQSLSTQQKTAVRTVDGPVLLLAVPGGGKTTVLITRLLYMILVAGIDPAHILTLTYTVAATGDMTRRYEALSGETGAPPVEFRTINGICAKIIYYFGRRIGRSSFRLLSDDKAVLKILSDIYRKHEREYATESELRDIRARITYIKNMCLKNEDIARFDEDVDYDLSGIYADYCARLRSEGLMDYDDQMVYALTILKKSPETLSYFQDLYRYICVDEAQDTSYVQHAIISLLASKYENLFMVGDEDQSIYGFRAAYPEALLSFEKDHPGGQVLLMEDNFRSVPAIVKAADAFIAKNMLRHEKHMRASGAIAGKTGTPGENKSKAGTPGGTSERYGGPFVREILLKARGGQYTYLAKVAENPKALTAVLYRDNESMVPLADLLERQGIPYRVRHAELTFFTSRVVTDVKNILRFALDGRDRDLFLQIYYKLNLYLSKEAASEACRISAAQNIPLLDAASRIEGLRRPVYQAICLRETEKEVQ